MGNGFWIGSYWCLSHSLIILKRNSFISPLKGFELQSVPFLELFYPFSLNTIKMQHQLTY